METQVQQLKINVTNIRSVLKNANKQNLNLRKDNKRLISQGIKESKVKQKESRVEKKISPSSSPLAAAREIASPSMGLFDKIINLGSILLVGVLANSLPGIFKKIDEFKEENKEIIDSVVIALTKIQDFALWAFTAMEDPESKEGRFDKIAKFDDQGNITGGALKNVEDLFNGFGHLINKIDKAMGGKGTAGNAFIKDPTKSYAAPSRESLVQQTERGSGMSSFREDAAENAALQQRVSSGSGATGGTKEQRAMLDTISYAEGTTASYGTIYGGRVVPELAQGKLTIAQVLEMQRTGMLNGRRVGYVSDSYNSDATGKYQFMSYVLREEMQKQNISPDTLFTPAMQDKIILGRISRMRGVTPGMLAREGMSANVIDRLAPEFASFPNLLPANTGVGHSPERYGYGNSYYGQGGKSATSIRNYYNNRLGGTRPKVEAKKGDDMRASLLNTTVGEEGTTNFVFGLQTIVT